MKIGNNSPYDKFITSTVYLDADEAVASRKIDLEFKNVIPHQNHTPPNPNPPELKETEIFSHFSAENFKSTFDSIGKAYYTITKQSEISEQRASKPADTIQQKLEKKYQISNPFTAGKIVNSIG